ncbi:MAG: translation initiation factor IF-2 N-terminal domain-containing protein, partial [Planctomycetota bacterium]
MVEQQPAVEAVEPQAPALPDGDAPPKKKRSRRGRRGGRKAAARAAAETAEPSPVTEVVTEDVAEPGKTQDKKKRPKKKKSSPAPEPAIASEDGGPIRVHTLAKQLGVTSRDLIDRCRNAGVEVKSHMSTLTAEVAEQARVWFAGAETAAEEDGQANSRPRRRRRGRRGGRRSSSSKSDAGAVSKEQVEP